MRDGRSEYAALLFCFLGFEKLAALPSLMSPVG